MPSAPCIEPETCIKFLERMNVPAHCGPVIFAGRFINANPVPGERLPDNFHLSGPHRPADNFHLSGPAIKRVFLNDRPFADESNVGQKYNAREYTWPKLLRERVNLAKTVTLAAVANSISRKSTGDRRLRFSARLLSQSTQSRRLFGTGAIYMVGPSFAASHIYLRSLS